MAGKRFVHGFDAGRKAIKVYVCTNRACEVHHRAKPPVQCHCGGINFDRFDSVGEANHWASLRLREKRGMLSNLRRQVPIALYALSESGLPVKVADLIVDYEYDEDGVHKRVDFKPADKGDPLFSLKARWAAAQGTPVTVVTA